MDKIKLTENELKTMIADSIKNILNEAYETVQWQHFDNDPKRYESYVLVADGDGSVIYNYTVYPGDFWKEVLDEAIADADEMAAKNKYGSYSVYGCEGDEYDEETLVYNTDNTLMQELTVEDYVRYPKRQSPYDDTKQGNGITQPVKDGVDLHDIRMRISTVLQALRNNRSEDAKKQLLRLYKLVDAMINQGF